jgi:hypothetical protein
MSKIKIEVKKFIENGDRKVRIINVKCKESSQLPQEYLNSVPCCFYVKEYDCIAYSNYINKAYHVGDILHESEFILMIDRFEKCIRNLKKINKQIKEEAKKDQNWFGIVKTTI